jgi:predicted MFS family arabinose efflux permease
MPPLILLTALLEGVSLTLIQGYLPLYLRSALGEPSYLTVALVVALPALGAMVASNVWGGLSDVSGRLKPFILLGLTGYVIALMGIPAFHTGFSVLLFVGAASLLYGTTAPSLKTYATLVKPDRKEFALASVLMAQSTGWLLGAYGAGGLLEHGIGSGLRLALWSCAGVIALHLIVTSVALKDLRREPAPARSHESWAARIAADLGSLYENPRLFRLCTLAFFFVAANYIVWGFFSVYMVEHLHSSIRTLRYSLAASSVLGIISFLYVGFLIRRFKGRLVLAVGITLYLGMYLGVALARSPVIVGIIYALPLYSLVNVSANVLASEYSTERQRAGGLGVLNGAYALAMIAGPVTGGLLADRVGLGAVPWLAMGFIAAAAPVAWFQVRAARREAIPSAGRLESAVLEAGGVSDAGTGRKPR